MNLVVVAQEYPADGSFKGLWCENQVRVLATRHRVSVVVPREDVTTRVEREVRDGVPVFHSRYVQRRRTWWTPTLLAIHRGCRAAAAEARPDLLHAHMGTRAGWATVLTGRAMRLPVVVTEHWGSIAERATGRGLAARALRYAVRRADAWIAVSQTLAGEIDRLKLRPPVPVVGNVMEAGYYDLQPESPPAGPLRLVTVARLDNEAKGWEVLLRALALVREAGVPAGLTLLGDGPARRDVADQAARLGLAGHCRFTGWQSPEAVRRELAAAHAFISATEYETFGLAALEALACGRPVIVPAVGALPEVVPPWAGWLVTERSPEALAAAVRELARGDRSFDPLRLAGYARERCSREQFIEQLEAIYASVRTACPSGSAMHA